MSIDLTEASVREMLADVIKNDEMRLNSDNFAPYLAWLREDLIVNEELAVSTAPLPVAYLFPEMGSTDEVRRKLALATAAVSSVANADYLLFAADCYGAKKPTRHDGQEWARGAMEYAYLNKTVDADLVFEQVTYTIATKDGWCAMVGVPYDRDGDKIIFRNDDATVLVESIDDMNESAAGFVPDMMREAMAAEEPPLVAGMRHIAESMDVSEDERRIYMLCAMCGFISDVLSVQIVLPARTDQEVAIMNQMNGYSLREITDQEEDGND